MTTEAPAAAEEVPNKERWVYMGRRLDTKHKLVYQWCPVDADGNAVPAAAFTYDSRIESATTMSTPKAGAIFTVHTLKAGQSVKTRGPHAPVYDTMLEDTKLIAEWDVRERADLIGHKANHRMKEEMNEDMLGKSLAPVLRAMKKTNAMGRAAIKLVVLDYLTRHGG